MKKGFTLVELMAVIIILGIVSVLIIPLIDRMVQSYRHSSYESQIRTIKLASKNYASDKLTIYPLKDGAAIFISLGQLKVEGYLPNSFSNPLTQDEFENNTLVKVMKKEKQFVFDVIEENNELAFDIANSPLIRLVGSHLYRMCHGARYVEPGIYAEDHLGNVINEYSVVYYDENQGAININSVLDEGFYYGNYTVTHSGIERRILRTIIVESCG